jgi:hypothetical protein
MTERKFTPPTKFPAEYENEFGDKITLRCKGIGKYPYAGQAENGGWIVYGADGSLHADPSGFDLHDIPQKQVHWANDCDDCITKSWRVSRENADASAPAGRIAVIRREWVEGELPQYFTEEV